jgi:hypothetical protein
MGELLSVLKMRVDEDLLSKYPSRWTVRQW